jgi:MFS family permease
MSEVAETVAPPSRRNYVLGVLNGALGTVAYDFVHPDLLLNGLIFAVSRPAFGDLWAYFLVAILSVLNKGGSLLPQLYVSSHLEHRPRKQPFYIGLTVLRGIGAALLVSAIWLMASRVDAVTMGLFFLGFLIVAVAMGAGHVITLDMFGRMIQLDRLGTFLGTREFLGGALSFVAGLFLVQPILNRGHAEAGQTLVVSNYFILGFIGSVLTIIAMGFLILCREEEGPRARRRTTFGESLVRGWRWLKRSPDYRSYFWLRVAFRVNDLAMVFFLPYGQEKLSKPGDLVGVAALGGVLVATYKLSRVLSSALWGWTVDRYGDRTCLVWTGVCFLLGPILALAAPRMPAAFSLPLWGTRTVLDLPLVVYMLALVAIGAAYQGSIIGGNRFLIGRAPPRRRLSYIGFLNTVTSPLTLLPLAAAAVAGHFGVTTLFAAIISGGVLFFFAARKVRPESELALRRLSRAAGVPTADGGP